MAIRETWDLAALELEKLDFWITKINERIARFNPAQDQPFILSMLRRYAEQGHYAVMTCLRSIKEELEREKRITKEKQLLRNILDEFRVRSMAVVKAYEHLRRLPMEFDRVMVTVISLRESLDALQTSRNRVNRALRFVA